jgi:hypothetical protein
MTEAQIETRLTMLEGMIARERNTSTLKALTVTYQKLMDRLVEMDLAKQAKGNTNGDE